MSTTRHPPMTALDADAMQAAVRASFRGLYGREPSGLPGSGADDVGYWVRVSDHYGQFSDGIERAGWSRYWELKLGGADSVDPKLGDVPATFQPTILPPSPTPPAPDPTLALILSRLDKIDAELAQLQAEHIALSQQVYRTTLWGYRVTLTPGPP